MGIPPTRSDLIGPILLRPNRNRFFYPMKTIHVAEMIAQGGRDGRVEAPDGQFAVELSTNEQPESVTPEHLFGGAYAACFLGTLKAAMERAHLQAEGVTLVAKVHLDEDAQGASRLNVDLRASLPGISESDARHLMHLAHQTCPYSRATRGNINVTLSFD